ncbi:MAG: sulfotransferase [Actinobacteria bacterium]|nr:sulfotransferase [Actinomycetota bacterium]
MMGDTRGEPRRALRPVFVLSLPRSGSTLVQRVLAAHPGVATAPEPWVLLPLLYTRRHRGVAAEYDHGTLVRTLDDLAHQLPGGERQLQLELVGTALRLYESLSGPDDRWFVDKTPRYHLILDDLIELLPEARFVFVWRSPVAIVGSMIRTWYDGRFYPNRHALDLYDGLAALVAGRRRLGERAVAVRYEDLVRDRDVWRSLTAHLGFDLDHTVFDQLGELRIEGYAGDPTQNRYGVLQAPRSQDLADAMGGPIRRRWARTYLDWIGDDRLAVMGYDAAELRAQVDQLPVDPWRLVPDTWAGWRERWRSTVRSLATGRGVAHERGSAAPPAGDGGAMEPLG